MLKHQKAECRAGPRPPFRPTLRFKLPSTWRRDAAISWQVPS